MLAEIGDSSTNRATNIAPPSKQIIYNNPNLGLEILPVSSSGKFLGEVGIW